MATFDLALDLGSGYVSVLTKANDIVIKQRNIVALNAEGKVLAFGNDAYRMRGAEGVRLAAPFKECAIQSRELTEAYFNWLFNLTDEKAFASKRVRVLAVANCGINTAEKRDWEAVLVSVGAQQVAFLESPRACAKYLANRYGLEDCMVVNLGSNAVDFGCLINTKMTNGCSLYLAGQDMDIAVKKFVELHYNVRLSLMEAEEAKRQCSLFENDISTIAVRGTNFETGKEQVIDIPARSLFDTMRFFADKYCQVVKSLLRSVDFAIAEKIKLGGIFLSGGGSGLHGLQEYMSKQLNIRVLTSDAGSNTAVFGARMLLLDGEFR